MEAVALIIAKRDSVRFISRNGASQLLKVFPIARKIQRFSLCGQNRAILSSELKFSVSRIVDQTTLHADPEVS
jgi:hypothetical protein